VAGQRTFGALDSDKDGQISAEEFALIHHATFAVMDANHDGEVSVAEATAYQRLPWTLGMFR
jgi:Ca2+-binding EF-hand superfamily protein